MSYAEVTAVLASKGLDGLSHEEQIAALNAEGYQGGPMGVTPYCADGYEYNPNKGECVPDVAPDCGKNPYNFNDVQGVWERQFNRWCHAVTGDPFEVIFHKMVYTRVQNNLTAVGLGGLSHQEQIEGLAALGYWDIGDGSVPDGGLRFE
jgi:hypothetical protein